MIIKFYRVTSRPFPQSTVTQEVTVTGVDEAEAKERHQRMYPTNVIVDIKETSG